MSGFSSLFSPLGKEYCAYFYYVSVLAFFMFLLTLYHVLVKLLKGKIDILASIITVGSAFLMYIVNRLLHTMCVGSVV
jgi:hypothetical protein